MFIRIFLFIILLLSTFSCSFSDIKYNYPDDPQNFRGSRAGKFFKDDLVLYGGQKSTSDLKDGSKLFVASSQVVDDLIALDIADPEIAMVSSKWQRNKKTGEVTKIKVIIKSDKLALDSLDIKIYKKYQDKNGKWQSKKSDNDKMLAKLIKQQIITKARSFK